MKAFVFPGFLDQPKCPTPICVTLEPSVLSSPVPPPRHRSDFASTFQLHMLPKKNEMRKPEQIRPAMSTQIASFMLPGFRPSAQLNRFAIDSQFVLRSIDIHEHHELFAHGYPLCVSRNTPWTLRIYIHGHHSTSQIYILPWVCGVLCVGKISWLNGSGLMRSASIELIIM